MAPLLHADGVSDAERGEHRDLILLAARLDLKNERIGIAVLE